MGGRMMATYDKQFADRLIAGNGRLLEFQEPAPDNPAAQRIVKYTNAWGREAFGVTFEGDDPEEYLRETRYVRNPVIYWEAE